MKFGPSEAKKLSVRIGIIGGSISGLALAIQLLRRGADVTILERSRHLLLGRGVGNALPGSFVDQCIQQDLFDKDIPRLPVDSRSLTYHTQRVLTQPFKLTAFNWGDIYHNLYKRIPPVCLAWDNIRS